MDDIDKNRMRVHWTKGLANFQSFFTLLADARNEVGNAALPSWCYNEIGIGFSRITQIAKCLREEDRQRVRQEFLLAEQAHKAQKLAERLERDRQRAEERKRKQLLKEEREAERLWKAAQAKKAKKNKKQRDKRAEEKKRQKQALKEAAE